MFADVRSRKLILVAHCVLNQNSLSDGTADYPASNKEVVDLLLQSRVGIVQMPCPELHMAVARYVSDRIAIMYLGKIVEVGDAQQLLERPLHPYTKALVAAVPSISSKLNLETSVLPGEKPDEGRTPSGCRFHPRCPYAEKICTSEEPALREIMSSRHVACHLVEIT